MLKEIRKELNKAITENGDTAYRTTSNANLDFFGSAGALRNNIREFKRVFYLAYEEDKELALKNLFYLRDIREGLGERDLFRIAYREICRDDESIARALIPYIVKYGRFDDLFIGLRTSVDKDIVMYIKNQLDADIENNKLGKSISLLAKWMPSINASDPYTRKMGLVLSEKLGYTKSEYRKMLSNLRKDIIIENELCLKRYTFDYGKVTSCAMHKYRNAFIKNDIDRYRNYLSMVNQGLAKINVGAIYPYQIIKEYENGAISKEIKDGMEVKWNSLKRSNSNTNTIVVRDGSGSMTFNNGLPNYIATSLAILFSEQLTGEFKNKFITFSSRPELIELPDKTLYDKLKKIYKYNDCMNTDINKVYDLILSVAKKKKISQEDMVKRIVIISDMEFDMGIEGKPTYKVFEKKFKKTGYELPEVIYWNVNARKVHFAALPTNPNIRLVSGASQHVIDSIITNEATDAYSLMIKTLDKYQFIENLF